LRHVRDGQNPPPPLNHNNVRPLVATPQICSAYKTDGGRCVVVLSTRSKVEMEMTFRRIIPDEKRFGSSFVFRSGSPLVPSDLRRVAASAASALIVVADTSRSLLPTPAPSIAHQRVG